MILVYTQAARDDFADLATYLESRHPFAIANVADDILVAIDRLTDFPFSGRRQDEARREKAGGDVEGRECHRPYRIQIESAGRRLRPGFREQSSAPIHPHSE